uniref:HsdM family class I SAM-dependent methyltransferase n=1 Tax=Rheinheimera sp. TaxID=1869214 RepID=UPI004048C8C2
MNNLHQALAYYGVRGSDCVDLEQVQDHRLLRYVDLLGCGKSPAVVEAVVESQSQPLLYVITSGRLTGTGNVDSKLIADLRRKLAMRGEPAWLGVLWPGRLDIYSTDLQPEESIKGVMFDGNKPESVSVIPRLANGENLARPAELQLREVLFGLMTDAGVELRELGLSVNESIALTGRALFFRFLIGRGIINDNHLSLITRNADHLTGCFGNEKSIAETNYWLDKTFNGDLLHLPTDNYYEYFHHLYEKHGAAVARPLSAILGLDDPLGPGASQGRLHLGWGDLDFDHIPVGLLSETYEELMRQFDEVGRHETSVYYTPSHIAEYMVAEALHLNPQGSRAKVLDPACGAGVFLTATFRRLAELQFEENGVRPDRSALRKILNTQLVGFDINGHARMLGALALYLTALELDPYPTPLEDLIFDKLEGKVFINVADPGIAPDALQPMLGSIGSHVPDSFQHSFDLVIGNPPWTALSGTSRKLNKAFTARCREIAAKRGLPDIAESYENPDNVPDLPFIWCATEWAKENGRICFALAGRFLFKRGGNGLLARQALFRMLAVTGILNGAALRKTLVWPNMSQPFCLLFADNRIPEPDDQFVFISPEEDPSLNRKGRIRIDASDSEAVTMSQVLEHPVLFKTLFRGTSRDVEFIKRLTARAGQTLGDYWVPENGLCSGQGFQVASRGFDDSFLEGLPEISAHYKTHPFYADPDVLPRYQPQGLWRPRSPEIYRGPLVLLRKATRPERDNGRALFSARDIAYHESFYGFSAAERDDGEFVTQYLLVLVHSALFVYYQLMTSAEFGIEREAIQIRDAQKFPFIAPERLSPEQRELFVKAAKQLICSKPDWDALDQAVFSTYRIGRSDAEMIRDTLDTRAPFTRSIACGLRPVDSFDTGPFCDHLNERLNSVLSRVNVSVKVELLSDSAGLPWRFIKISRIGSSGEFLKVIPSEWVRFADDYSVSRIFIANEESQSIIVGLLDRYRYWTPTQARMLASDIIWQHGAMLEGNNNG